MSGASSFDAIVVGAGVAGLFCATALADAGLRVAVLEARGAAGGRARSRHEPHMGFDVDIGPHVVTTEHVNFMRMLRRLGTDGDIAWQPQPMISLLDAGEVLDIPCSSATPPFHGLPVLPVALRRLGLRDALSHMRVAWHAARCNDVTLRELDSLDALTWLRRKGVSTRAIDWFWRSAMLALLNVPLEQCSAAAAMRVFRLMMGRSGYHFGFPKVGLSDLYVPHCEAAIRGAGGEVRMRCAVRALEVEHDAVVGVRLRTGEVLRAPWCVLAVAPWNLPALIERTSNRSGEGARVALTALADNARKFIGAPYTSTVLALDRSITQRKFWARVWNPRDHNTDFYDLAHIRPGLQGGGSVIAANAIGPNAHLEWSDEQVIARTMAELGELSPSAREARVMHASIHRIRAAIPQPRPGTEAARPSTLTAVAGLLLAGDWLDTAVPCSMESAARAAALAAEIIVRKPLALPAPETWGLVAWFREPVPAGTIGSRASCTDGATPTGKTCSTPSATTFNTPSATTRSAPRTVPRFTGSEDALAYFDSLPPVDSSFLIGEWRGEECPTGHPFDGVLAAYHWHGKRFEDADHVHPLLFGTAGHTFAVQPRWLMAGIPLLLRFPSLKEERVAAWLRPALGLLRTSRPRARLRAMEHRGKPTAAMVYDEIPVIDYFRKVDENTVLGLMDLKGMERPYFFVLRRTAG